VKNICNILNFDPFVHALTPVMSVNYLLHRKQTTYSTFTADSEWLYI